MALSPSLSPSLSPELRPILTGNLFGIILSFCFYGGAVVQAFTYYQAKFRNEALHIRILAIWCTVVETLHSIFITLYLYEAVIAHFGDEGFPAIAQWELVYSVTLSAAVAGPVQIFYAYRIYILSKNWIYLVVISVATLARTGLVFATSIIADRTKLLPIFESQYHIMVAFSLGLGTIIDILNTSTLCYLVATNKGEMVKSKSWTDKLVVWVVETGLMTSVAGTWSLITLLAAPQNGTWNSAVLFTGKLYSCSLFASLNGRLSLRAAAATSHISLATFAPRATIRVDTVTEVHVDVVGKNTKVMTKDSDRSIRSVSQNSLSNNQPSPKAVVSNGRSI